MIDKLNTHYSMTNPASVYDEESLTALELAGRTTAKVNEVVDAQNELSENVTNTLNEQNTNIENIRTVTVPDDVSKEVQKQINNGTFDSEINKYSGDLQSQIHTLNSRVSNLSSLDEGTTTGDAEIIDGRVGYDGYIYNSIGDAIRGQCGNVNTKIDDIKKDFYTVSERNIIQIIKIDDISATPQDNFTLKYDRVTDELTINGSAESDRQFMLYVDGAVVPDDTIYIKWLENIFTGQPNSMTWSFELYFSDGTKSEQKYTNVNHFFNISEHAGKTIVKIMVRFGTGFVFENYVTKLHTDMFNNGFIGYEPKYFLSTKKVEEELYRKYAGKTWLSIGDSITGNSGNTGTQWQQTVAEYFGFNKLVSSKGGITTAGLTQDDLFFNNLPDVQPDIITVMAGTNDFSQSVRLENNDISGYYNTGWYNGSIRLMIKKLQTKYPNAKIIFCTCLGVKLDVAGTSQETPVYNSLNLTMVDYANMCLKTCQSMNIPCINLCGESGINHLNGGEFITDTVHPNTKGYKRIADVYINNFKRLLF